MRLLKIAILISGLLNIQITIAQNVNEKNFEQEKFTIAKASYTYYGVTEFKEDGVTGEVGFSEFRGAFYLPKLLNNKKTILVNGLEFSSLIPEFKSDLTTETLSRDFYSISYNLGAIHFFNNRVWSMTINLKPTLASDFKEKISSDDFIFQGTILVTKKRSKHLKYGLGLSYNTRFGAKQILPILQLVYKTDRWETMIYLPAYISQFYKFTQSKLGLTIGLNGNNYNFRNNSIVGLDLDKLGYSRVNIGPDFETKLSKNLRINLNAGISVANKLDWLDADGDSVLDLSPENKFFAKIELKLVK